MAHRKVPSEALDDEQRKVFGDDSATVTRAEKVVSSLVNLSAAAIVKASMRSRPLVFAVPFTISTARRHCDALLAGPLLCFTSATQLPPGRRVATSSPDASVENRRLLAEIRQELGEGNEDTRQVEGRLACALAKLNTLLNTIQDFGSQQLGVRWAVATVQRHGSGLPVDAPSEATSDPRQGAAPNTPRPPVASNRPSSVSFRDELYEAGRQMIESGANRARLHRLIDDLEQTCNSFQLSVETIIATSPPAVSPCSQTWVPQNLAMMVSRVYYYSCDYAEEVISAPLEVSGYTVRLAVRCTAEHSCVKLMFRARFCSSFGNDAVQWPFRGAVQLVIHHPRNPASNRVYRVHPSQDIETIMPRNTNNAFFYLAGPISALSLDQRGFWAMKTLHLSIKILPEANPAADA